MKVILKLVRSVDDDTVLLGVVGLDHGNRAATRARNPDALQPCTARSVTGSRSDPSSAT